MSLLCTGEGLVAAEAVDSQVAVEEEDLVLKTAALIAGVAAGVLVGVVEAEEEGEEVAVAVRNRFFCDYLLVLLLVLPCSDKPTLSRLLSDVLCVRNFGSHDTFNGRKNICVSVHSHYQFKVKHFANNLISTKLVLFAFFCLSNWACYVCTLYKLI